MFASKTIFSNSLIRCRLQDLFKDLFKSYYGECLKHLTVRSGEYISISPLINKKVQPR